MRIQSTLLKARTQAQTRWVLVALKKKGLSPQSGPNPEIRTNTGHNESEQLPWVTTVAVLMHMIESAPEP
jgi:hypothetical protein